ncbi:MAG: alpha/beta hydrolase [Gemmataceae bacterium]
MFRNTLVVLALCASAATAADVEKKTYVYKTVDGVKVEADVYRSADDKVQPVVVWIHGGALVNGSRAQAPGNLRELCAKEGYTLVSLDYRLAPQVKLPAIIDDIKDAFRWLREKGPELLHIDPKRIVVTGGSAGGYLTMMTGICVEPRPLALVAYWGYGDVDGDWYVKPSEHYRQLPLVKKEEAYQGIDKQVVSGATTPEERKARSRYYLYLRQNGLWTREITGFDPKEKAKLDPYCPVRNLTKDYPPILMVHGTVDTDVPYELSKAMADGLKKAGGKHELITVPDAGHGLSGGDPKLVRAAHERALDFIREQLK